MPGDNHISVSKKQVVATHINSGAIILGALISLLAGGIVGGWELQRFRPVWQGEEQSLFGQIKSQQNRISELSAAETNDSQRLITEEAKSQEIEQQLQSELEQIRKQLADAQDTINSKDQLIAKAQTELQLKDQQLVDARKSKLGGPNDGATSRTSGENTGSQVSKTAPNHQADVGEFRLESHDCTRTGTRVHCVGTITNLGTDPQNFHFRWNESSIVDNLGGQLPLSDQIFKFGDGSNKPLQPHLPIAFVITVDDPQKNASLITLVLSEAASQFPQPMEHNATIRLEFSIPPP
jgi:gas vesicle protein